MLYKLVRIPDPVLLGNVPVKKNWDGGVLTVSLYARFG
jgi:hypothetical protein